MEERFYEEVLQHLTIPLFVLSHENDCIFANRELVHLLKYPLDGLADVLSIAHFWPAYERFDWSASEGGAEFLDAKGGKLSVKLSVRPCGEARIVQVIDGGTSQDVSTRYHAQRLETLGMLAGGVAHDFNNILAGILGHVTYLKTILPTKGPHVESLIAVEEGGKKASMMTQQILNFSRFRGGEKPERVALNELVTKTCLLLRGAISPSITLEKNLDEVSHYALANEGGLAQIVVNLVINARDALGQQGGTIRVEVAQVTDPEPLYRAFGTRELSSTRYVCLRVQDTGHGIPAEILSKIFEPYFTTKKTKGTGLGLSTVLSLVRGYGGGILVDSIVGGGTTFSIYLPEAEMPQQPPQDSPGSVRRTRLLGGDESILVIDDEYAVRNVLSMSLQHLGYHVENASSGAEGIEKYTALGAKFDLILLDMLMPNMPGDKVFAHLKRIDPSVRVLVISGYTSEEAVRSILDNGGLGFLQKPFTIEELSKKVRECLDGLGRR